MTLGCVPVIVQVRSAYLDPDQQQQLHADV
jgi:hypothetical protein